MTERVWDFNEGSTGGPQTPSSPPVAPSRTGQIGSPPVAAPAAIVQAFEPQAYQPQAYQAQSGRPGLTGPPIIGEPVDAAPADKGPRWGLRVAGAFLAGGLLTGGGFVAGQLVADENTLQVDTTATPASTQSTTLPPSEIVLTPPDPDVTEPAAYVAAVLGPSIVQIETELGVGSGIVFDDGLVITNHHVIVDAVRIRVRTSDGRTLAAELVGSDSRVDVAVLNVGENSGLQVATLALDEDPEVGQAAFALGSPFQLQQSISAGIVSAINRPVSNGEGINAMIQSDTSVNPGNSGGALADRAGRVIGINTSIRTDGVVAGSVGISFSIPIDNAMRVADRILAGQSLAPGFLGVGNAQDAPGGEAGVVIGEVTPGSGAEEAGVQIGDRVIRIDGVPVTSLGELAGLIRASFPGDVIELEIVRGEESLLIAATLGEQ